MLAGDLKESGCSVRRDHFSPSKIIDRLDPNDTEVLRTESNQPSHFISPIMNSLLSQSCCHILIVRNAYPAFLRKTEHGSGPKSINRVHFFMTKANAMIRTVTVVRNIPLC